VVTSAELSGEDTVPASEEVEPQPANNKVNDNNEINLILFILKTSGEYRYILVYPKDCFKLSFIEEFQCSFNVYFNLFSVFLYFFNKKHLNFTFST
jgi:hypothetical protein